MNIADFLAELLRGQGQPQNRMSGNWRGADSAPNRLIQPMQAVQQMAPQMAQQAAPMPQVSPPAAIAQPQAPQPDQLQTASVAPPQASGGGLLSRLFGGGQSDGENQTIQWLQQQGIDPGTATMMAKSKPILQAYLLKRSQGVDPKDALQAEKLGLEIDQLKHPQPGSDWSKMDDGRLFNQRTGEIKDVGGAPDVKTRTMTPDEVKAAGLAPGVWQIDKENKISKAGDAAPVPGGKFRFDGASIEGQALNGLMDSGALTEDQAQQLAAGKLVTNPADGSTMFLTPRGIFTQPAGGGVATPVQPPNAQPAAQQPPPAAAAYVPPASPSNVPPPAAGPAQDATSGAPPPPVNPGLIPITGAKPSGKKTEAEERYTTISTILLNEVPTLGANFSAMSDPSGQLLSKLPGGIGNMWQSEEYQRAASSVKTSISSILYALSGASSNPGEVINQIGALTPEFGDKPGLVADKLQRFKVYVRAVATGTGDPKLKAMVDDALSKMDTQPSSTRKIYDDLATGNPAAAEGWREVAPGVKLRKVN